jgi:hypothetical protein
LEQAAKQTTIDKIGTVLKTFIIPRRRQLGGRHGGVKADGIQPAGMAKDAPTPRGKPQTEVER